MTKKTKTIKGKGNYLPRRRRVAPQPQPQPEPEPEFILEDDPNDEGFEENERYVDLLARRNLANDYVEREGNAWIEQRRRAGLPTRDIPYAELPDGLLMNLANLQVLNQRLRIHPFPTWVRGEIIPLVAEYPIYEERNRPIEVDNTERMVVPFADQVIVSNLSDLGSLSGSSNSSRSSNPSFNSQSVNYSVPSDDSYFSLNFEDVSNQPSDLSNYSSDRSNRSSISSLSSQGEGIKKKRILLSHNEIPQLRSNSFQKPFYFGGNQVPPHLRGYGCCSSSEDINRIHPDIPIEHLNRREHLAELRNVRNNLRNQLNSVESRINQIPPYRRIPRDLIFERNRLRALLRQTNREIRDLTRDMDENPTINEEENE